jgi:hypothetical protein
MKYSASQLIFSPCISYFRFWEAKDILIWKLSQWITKHLPRIRIEPERIARQALE